LIVLIINAHSRDPTKGPGAHIDRKTSLLRDRPDGARGQASASTTPPHHCCRNTILADHVPANERHGAWSMRTAFDFRRTADSVRSPLHDVRQHARSAGGGGARNLHLLPDEPSSSAP
jgi:hypothetical protein